MHPKEMRPCKQSSMLSRKWNKNKNERKQKLNKI
jgi:hypothetical protein